MAAYTKQDRVRGAAIRAKVYSQVSRTDCSGAHTSKNITEALSQDTVALTPVATLGEVQLALKVMAKKGVIEIYKPVTGNWRPSVINFYRIKPSPKDTTTMATTQEVAQITKQQYDIVSEVGKYPFINACRLKTNAGWIAQGSVSVASNDVGGMLFTQAFVLNEAIITIVKGAK